MKSQAELPVQLKKQADTIVAQALQVFFTNICVCLCVCARITYIHIYNIYTHIH